MPIHYYFFFFAQILFSLSSKNIWPLRRKAHGKNMEFNLVKPMEAQMNERIVDGGDRVLTINKYRLSSPHSVAE